MRRRPPIGRDGDDGGYHRGMEPMRSDRIAVADGVELAVDLWAPAAGSSPTASGSPSFVLVHGLASNARTWDGVVEQLVRAGHPVVTVDLRGHGRASKPDGPYDVPTVADDLARLIEVLELDRPVVAGQSWGGNVVLELGARRPELVRGIVCVDGGWLEPSRGFPDWETCRDRLAPPRLAGRPLGEIEARIRASHPDWPETGIRGTLANFEIRPDGTVAPWLTYERHLAVLRGLWEHHPSTLYRGLQVPVLLVPVEETGSPRLDEKRAGVEAARAAIPTCRVEWLSGDHDIHAQRPVELAMLMRASVLDGFFG